MNKQAVLPHTRFLVLFLLSLLPYFPCRAGEAPALTLTKGPKGVYELDGSFTTTASRARAWGVLTDYERIPTYVKSVITSRVMSKDDHGLLLFQRFTGTFLIFTKTADVELRVVQTEDGKRLEFRDEMLKDFAHYEGEWDLQPSPSGSLVHYHLSVKPRFSAPAFLKRHLLQSRIRTMFKEVQREMEKQ